MKKIFSHENMITFGLVIAAVTIAAVFVIPIVKNFIPAGIMPMAKTTTTTTAAPTS